MIGIKPSEITPEHLYLSRRRFIKGIGALVAGSLVTAACGQATAVPAPTLTPGSTAAPAPTPTLSPVPSPTAAPAGSDFSTPTANVDELGQSLTPFDTVTNYNNFYEFSTSKDGVASLAKDLQTSPWEVEVGGLVQNPRTFSIDDLRKFTQEERIYRLRCVEAWSMVIPWLGFPLSRLLAEVEPLSQAQYVRFQTLYNADQMPGEESSYFPWPYVEGLRLDEAMHDLTLLATGLYGKPLLPQNGAPVRVVVPWKYGFKSIKSVVKIDLVEDLPVSFWMTYSPNEYGFYANVNPDVPHPRWSQATERRIGETGRIPTLLFNGYGDEVAHLYEGMDLKRWF
jgi:sulfoxide reductase catalytic subunit YedY